MIIVHMFVTIREMSRYIVAILRSDVSIFAAEHDPCRSFTRSYNTHSTRYRSMQDGFPTLDLTALSAFTKPTTCAE